MSGEEEAKLAEAAAVEEDEDEDEIRRWRTTVTNAEEDMEEEEEAGVVVVFAVALARWKDDVEAWTWRREMLRIALVAAMKKVNTRERTFFLLEASIATFENSRPCVR